MTDSVPELAAEISTDDGPPPMVMRVGVVTALEVGGNRRAQVDAGGDAWLNRLQDCQFAVGDRVSLLQQGPVLLIIGRLEGTDAFTPIGGIIPFAGTTAPTNWLLCDGSAVSRSIYASLFAVCGTTYGAGNGSTTFNLPNMLNRLPMGAGSTYVRGATSAGTVTLSTANLPAHDHGSGGSHTHNVSGSADSVGDHSHPVSNQATRSDILAGGGTTTASQNSTSTGGAGGHGHSLSGSADSAGAHTHTSVGTGTAFTPTGPYVALPYIIRAI
jgi:microcystin-dependent protein